MTVDAVESDEMEYQDADDFRQTPPSSTPAGDGVPYIASPHLGPMLPPDDIVNPAPPMPGGLDLSTPVASASRPVVVDLIEILDTEDEKENVAPKNEVWGRGRTC